MNEDTLEYKRVEVENAFRELAIAFDDLWIIIKEILREPLEELKEFSESIEKQLMIEVKPKWHPPKRLGNESQVMNRRPLMIRARSCC